MVQGMEARCRKLAKATARAGIDWVLHELAGRAALYGIVDEIVRYLVKHPDVEKLVQEQRATMVEQAVDDLRTGATRDV
jgi:hypothetical protein